MCRYPEHVKRFFVLFFPPPCPSAGWSGGGKHKAAHFCVCECVCINRLIPTKQETGSRLVVAQLLPSSSQAPSLTCMRQREGKYCASGPIKHCPAGNKLKKMLNKLKKKTQNKTLKPEKYNEKSFIQI